MSRPAIICVDDEPLILTSLRDQLLHHLGSQYSIEIAESGEEALELLEELMAEGTDIPLIIADQIMPGMKGDALLIETHQRCPQALKIFLTGQADAQAVGNVVNAANLYRYISKPWDEADLKLTVTKALYSYNQQRQFAEQNRLLEKLYAQARQEILERKRVEKLLAEANQTLEQKVKARTQALSRAVEDLQKTQNQLIMQEKLASLGMLTAGIAHELKNPLHFINSFAALNVELSRELAELLREPLAGIASETAKTAGRLLGDLADNAGSIHAEGKRADRIIQSMLMHARNRSCQPQPTDLNRLLDEAAHLAYHGMRGKESRMAVDIRTDYDESLPEIPVFAQDLMRVFINLIHNAYDAMEEKQDRSDTDYQPGLTLSTRDQGETIEIRIKDNGAGVPRSVQADIFTPFYTTKPAGQGTGLGLSISYEIIVGGHGGEMTLHSQEGAFTEFVLCLPKSHHPGPSEGFGEEAEYADTDIIRG